MSKTTLRAESPEFTSLTDAYTGERLDVFMVATPDGPKFCAPDAESPRRVWTVEEPPMRTCPYTGEALTLHHLPSGWLMIGGFDPRLPRAREEFLYYATMRNGKSRYPKPSGLRAEATLRVGRVTRRQWAHADKAQPRIDEFHVHSIEKSLAPFKGDIPGSSTVSMYTGGRS